MPPSLIPPPSQKSIGIAAELFASEWLTTKGLTPIAHNYHCAYGEVDIIAEHGDTLVFVEVRYRQTLSHGSALESVTPRKQRRIAYTAMHYLHAHQIATNVNCRFDVIGVCKDKYGLWQCQWIQGAFEYDD